MISYTESDEEWGQVRGMSVIGSTWVETSTYPPTHRADRAQTERRVEALWCKSPAIFRWQSYSAEKSKGA